MEDVAAFNSFSLCFLEFRWDLYAFSVVYVFLGTQTYQYPKTKEKNTVKRKK